MQDILDESLRVLKKRRERKSRLGAVLLILSLLVSADVFWTLRQPGLTLAGDADCGIVEHTHDAACGVQVCVCDIAESTHIHTEACYESTLTTPQENIIQICQLPVEPHIHNGNCYQTDVITDTESLLICQNQEHLHDESCYMQTEIIREERVLSCDISTEPHQHTEGCFTLEVTEAKEEKVLICTLPEATHIHEAACYEWQITCDITEHVHSISCYSDDTADVETLLDWQEMFAAYPYTGNLRDDLVGIAKTQVGYTESDLNFEIGSDGVRRGYTRYGAWYGTPYRDWSVIFVSFCLNYAGADPSQTPGNTGADAMAELWRNLGRYANVDEYSPVSGDLVFFANNTVGIVAEVQNSTLYVIRGDVEGVVCSDLISLSDENIIGWGLTVIPQIETDDSEVQTPEITSQELLDITNGPAVFIFAGEQLQSEIQLFSGRMMRSVTDLISYLEANGGNYFFTLLDINNQELPKDENGNYIVQANTKYKLTISITSPEGFLPGTYEYGISNGTIVDGGEGSFVLKDGTTVGNWIVTDDGLITLYFNDEMNSRTDITISATLGIHFLAQDDPIDFDGKISITVQKPHEELKPTTVTKWGMQGDETTAGKLDTTKLYWNVNIVGDRDSNIVGNAITDKVLTGEWMGDHRYTQSDMEAGLKFGASDPDWNWHSWTVYPGDPNLTWTEEGWTYIVPETINCWCGVVHLGNEGWVYYIDYSSTPYVTGAAGTLYYMNRITVDNQVAEGGANFTQGEILGEVSKTGSFVSDASGGSFLWEIQAMIPGMKAGQKSDYNWFLMDYMYLMNADGYRESPVHNDANLVMVTATYNGETFVVPRIQDATPNDPFAWHNAWTATNNGVEYGRQLGLLCRCNCNEDTCQFSNTGCSEYWFQRDDGTWATSGFCQCWAVPENVLFTFVYRTTDISVIESYGGIGYQLQNVAELYYIPPGSSDGAMVSISQAIEPIPGVFQKALTHDFNGYTAHYRVTVNEAKLNLTNGAPLTIHDAMTQTLAYISGSLVITTEDANGHTSTLRQDYDYTVNYNGAGTVTDEQGNPVHVLDIVILRPQPVMYILDYDTTLIIPPGTTQAIKYSNAATITIWGNNITNNTVEKIFADINIASKSYCIEVLKTSALTGEPLEGAKFGFYNDHGGLITTSTSDVNGKLLFQTNIIEGIILRDHMLYYIKELQAPRGYQVDDTLFWFCFCDSEGDFCRDCDLVMAGIDAVRIPLEQTGNINIPNEILDYDLPSTGGLGVYPLLLVGVTCIVTPLVYMFILRRKRERRGDG